MPEGNLNYLQEELYSLLQSDTNIFEFLRQGSLDGLWYWNLEQPEDEWMDSRFWEVLGFEPASKEHKVSAWQDLVHPDDLELAIKNFKRHCEDPSYPYDQIVRYSHANGSIVWVRCRGVAVRDDSGKPIRMLGVHTELTELMETEVKLQNATLEAQQEFVTLWEDSPVIHLHVSLASREIEKCNWNLVKRLGYLSKEEIEGHPIENIISPNSIHELENLLKKFKESKKAVQTEINLVTQGGEPVPVIINIARIKDGNWIIQNGSITCLEISELRELQHSERLSSFALEHATVSFYLVDPEANILQVNQSTCDNTGFSKEYLESCTVHDINPEFPREAWPTHWEELKQKGFLRFESIILRKDGSTYPAEIETNYVEFEGRAYNFAFVRDISERKAWIRQKELNEAKLEALVKERTKDLEKQRQAAIKMAEDAEAA